MPIWSRRDRRTGICSVNSEGAGLRVPLYSGYSLCLKVGEGRSNATARWSGDSSSTSLFNMERNPYTALVWVPSGAVILGGMA